MKLTDFLQDVGRPVAYYPELRKITGSVTATILLCQFIYWRGKESSGDGWLYKTADDIQDETGLSYGEQKTARRDLVQAGFIQEHYARLDHQMRFKVNLDAVNEKWGNEETHIPESGKPTFGNDRNQLSLNESENTAENTQPDFSLSSQDLAEVNAKVDYILAGQKDSWQGRELIRDNLLPLADWYNETTGQVMTKRVQKSWYKALQDWQDEGITPAHLQIAYDAQKAWRMVSDPNQLTKDAVAIKAAGLKAQEPQEPKFKDGSGYV